MNMETIQQNFSQFQLDLNQERRRAFLVECNDQLQRARDRIIAESRDVGGWQGTRNFSNDMDALLLRIYKWLLEEARVQEKDCCRVSIIAQGGYGRGQLNPHSDIDLFFLMPDNATPIEQAFVKSFLYMLWDLNKLDVGYATKKMEEALGALGLDLDSTTALITTRLLAGNRAALELLQRKLLKLLSNDYKRWFLSAKFEEYKTRREKFGSSVYMLEPNVKDGEGGLRDVHSMQWISHVLLGAYKLDTLVRNEVWTKKELDAVRRAFSFVLLVRTALHHVEGRKSDSLSFEKQPAVAAYLGYGSDEKLLAEERMMKDYYLHARVIDRYTQKATRILTRRARTAIGGMIEAIRRRSLTPDYYVKDGVLFLKQPKTQFFKKDSCRIMECFWIATRTHVLLSEELKDAISAALEEIDHAEFQNLKSCSDHFMKIMGQRRFVAQSIYAMHETGVLSAYMPEFEKLFCLARIDHYHKYTVDIHLIKTIEVSTELINASPEQRPEVIAVAKEIKRWDLLNLSLLLHDIGKGEGHGHVLRGAVISQKMTHRMHLPPNEQEVVRQLILQHLRMAHVSQRRDLEDPHTIQEMASTVPDPELLRMLYVLTYCDTKAVSPTAWTDWKGSLLFDLFRKTMLLLEGKDPLPPLDPSSRKRAKDQILEALGPAADPDRVEQFLNNVPPKYMGAVPPRKMAKHLQMIDKLTPDDRITWEQFEPEHLNYTEITAVSYDKPGFMSLVCQALSSKDINILSVQGFTTKDGFAVDIFQVTDLRGNRLPQGFRLDRLRNDLNLVLLGKAKPEEKFVLRKRAREVRSDLHVLKPNKIILDNDSSPNYTILEVKAFDRPGLLYDITSTCAQQRYVIHLAMITTEAYRVVDVFYLTDYEFNKLEPNQIKKLQSALETVVA
jgi:[protein-PII] uridylyltransferase